MFVRKRLHPNLAWAKSLLPSAPAPYYSTACGAAYHLDALKLLAQLPSDTIDLVMTSPPFALTRPKEYGNEPVERYLEWFMPFAKEIKRVLKPTGSFVFDIGGAWIPGVPVRSLYHFELAVKLSKEFHLAQDFYWHNPARLPSPAEWVTVRRVRVKDAVNTIWWFSKTTEPKADNRKVLQPYSESMKQLLRKGYKAKMRPSGHDISENFSRDNGGAIPSNLLSIANTDSNSHYLRECRKRKIKPHPARYPESLVQFFLNLLTDRDDLVYDPFSGSNVTGAACESSGRRWLATEVNADYLAGSTSRFDEPSLFDAIESPPTTHSEGEPPCPSPSSSLDS